MQIIYIPSKSLYAELCLTDHDCSVIYLFSADSAASQDQLMDEDPLSKKCHSFFSDIDRSKTRGCQDPIIWHPNSFKFCGIPYIGPESERRLAAVQILHHFAADIQSSSPAESCMRCSSIRVRHD